MNKNNLYIGIDLGTSGVKILLVRADGVVLAKNTQRYPVYYPESGWSEQNPSDWFFSTIKGINILLDGQNKSAVKGISFGGQMHGLVALDKSDNVIRPAILWNDGRTEKETKYLNEVIGRENLSLYTANIAFAGFTAPKIMWLKNNEPENFALINKIMLPKDYLVYMFTGAHVTDFSDAGGTLLFDVKNRCWSDKMCEICSVRKDWLPELKESYEIVGTIKKEITSLTGLPENIVVTAGAGDNAAAAVGTGTVRNGSCNISLGTSGTVFIATDKFSVDKKNSLHSLCHANGKYHLMGCILSAASCNSWWSDKILCSEDYNLEQKDLENMHGNNDVYFLPYLMGERSPHNDVNARGVFAGMRADTTRKQMTLAVLEGVAFALRDCVEVARKNNICIDEATICGGGAKSLLWCKIIADVLGIKVKRVMVEEGPGYGASILAMTGCNEYKTVEEATQKLVKIKDVILPDCAITEKYEKHYQKFKALYIALKDWYKI